MVYYFQNFDYKFRLYYKYFRNFKYFIKENNNKNIYLFKH